MLLHRGAHRVQYGVQSENIAKMTAFATLKTKNSSSVLSTSMKMARATPANGTSTPIIKMDTVSNTTSVVLSTKDTGKTTSITDMVF